MALFSMSVQSISRGKGRSAVAAAAYRSGKNLRSERDNTVKKSRSKSHVAHSQIYAPEHAPEWAKDREKLWNEVEKKENRKNSQLSREIRVSLHRELSDEQNKKLLETYIKRECVERGMVADVNIHHAKAKDGKPNPHAHIMLTLREFDENGEWKKHKNREWNDYHKEADRKGLYQSMRDNWQRDSNKALADAESTARVSSRSYKERGINRAPQPKIGYAAAKMEADGLASENGRRLRRVQADNVQRAMTEPPGNRPAAAERKAAPPRPAVQPVAFANQPKTARPAESLAKKNQRAMMDASRAEASRENRATSGGWRGYMARKAAALRKWHGDFAARRRAKMETEKQAGKHTARETSRRDDNDKGGKGRGR